MCYIAKTFIFWKSKLGCPGLYFAKKRGMKRIKIQKSEDFSALKIPELSFHHLNFYILKDFLPKYAKILFISWQSLSGNLKFLANNKSGSGFVPKMNKYDTFLAFVTCVTLRFFSTLSRHYNYNNCNSWYRRRRIHWQGYLTRTKLTHPLSYQVCIRLQNWQNYDFIKRKKSKRI